MITKEQAVQEILKSGKDQEYFVNNFCRIPHSVHGLVRFDTYDFQDQLLDDLEKYRFNVVLKARQMGISTIVGAHIAWLMMFHKHKNVLILCTKLQTATNLVKKVKEMVINKEALLIIGSPIRSMVESVQSNCGTEQWSDLVEKGIRHVEFLMELYQLQIDNHMYFLYENSEDAKSWELNWFLFNLSYSSHVFCNTTPCHMEHFI